LSSFWLIQMTGLRDDKTLECQCTDRTVALTQDSQNLILSGWEWHYYGSNL
jgi:hypothetical protein